MLPIKHNTELILHGGNADGGLLNGIWKYKSNKQTWTLIGSLLKPRGEHAAIAVKGLECP